MATESEHTRKLCKQLNEMQGVLAIAVVAHQFNAQGIPDRYISSRKWQGWVEFKAEAGRLSPMQQRTCALLHHAKPGQVFVIRWIDNDSTWGQVEDVFGKVLYTFGYKASDALDALRLAAIAVQGEGS